MADLPGPSDAGEPGRVRGAWREPAPEAGRLVFAMRFPKRGTIRIAVENPGYAGLCYPSEASHAGCPGADDVPLMQRPFIVRILVRASEFTCFVRKHLAGPAPPRLSPVILDELADLARELDAAIALGEPDDFDPESYIFPLESICILYIFITFFRQLISTWGWSGGWDSPGDGRPLLPGAADGVRPERVEELEMCLAALPPPARLYDERMVCQGCGSFHRPGPATDGGGRATACHATWEWEAARGDAGHGTRPAVRTVESPIAANDSSGSVDYCESENCECPVILGDSHKAPVWVLDERGRMKKKRLGRSAYRVIAALIGYGSTNLTYKRLAKLSGAGGAHGILTRLREDPDWMGIIRMPGVGGRGYYIRRTGSDRPFNLSTIDKPERSGGSVAEIRTPAAHLSKEADGSLR